MAANDVSQAVSPQAVSQNKNQSVNQLKGPASEIDLTTIAKYAKHAPRYTSYPTVLNFVPVNNDILRIANKNTQAQANRNKSRLDLNFYRPVKISCSDCFKLRQNSNLGSLIERMEHRFFNCRKLIELASLLCCTDVLL